MLEVPWHGTTLVDGETRLAGAQRMTWKSLHRVVAWSRKVYHKGRALGKKAMQEVARRLERHPDLPTWEILIRPVAAW